MPCMALGESLTGVSLLHAMDTVRGVTGTVTESEAGVCLALLVQGKWGIEMPHRNLLVMERKGPAYPYRYQYRDNDST